MKKVLAFMLAAMMMASMAVGCGNDGNTSSADAGTATDTSSAEATDGEEPAEEPAADASDVSIGSCVYKFDDTFMTGVRNCLLYTSGGYDPGEHVPGGPLWPVHPILPAG